MIQSTASRAIATPRLDTSDMNTPPSEGRSLEAAKSFRDARGTSLLRSAATGENCRRRGVLRDVAVRLAFVDEDAVAHRADVEAVGFEGVGDDRRHLGVAQRER